MVLSDISIENRCNLPEDHAQRLRVSPWSPEETVPERGLSYGLTSCGYDFRLSPYFTHLAQHGEFGYSVFADPTIDMTKWAVDEVCEQYFILQPGHMVLGMTVEWFAMARDTSGTVVGRSSYARCGLCLNTTVIEPGWEGHITLEMSNISSNPIKLHVGGGIGQLQFHMTDKPVRRSYADKKGRYQGQTRPTLPKPRPKNAHRAPDNT